MPFELVQRPDPVAGPGEAVARVITCGSGLTIQHAKAGRRRISFPRIIGHEITGEIAEVGPGVTGLKRGDAVTTYFYLNCGHCRWCLANLEPLCANSGGQVGLECDGGYAEYIKLPAQNFIKLPDALDYRAHPAEIGVITDALATPYKVLSRARIKAGETVAVMGAGGGLGIHQLMMAKWARARVIAVDTRAAKFEACRKAGADEVVDASAGRVVEQLMELTNGDGVDVVVDYVSSHGDAGGGRQGARPPRPAGDARRLGPDIPGVRRRHAQQGAGSARQPLRYPPRNFGDARHRGARRGVPAGQRNPPAGASGSGASTGRARRGHRTRRAADRMTTASIFVLSVASSNEGARKTNENCYPR